MTSGYIYIMINPTLRSNCYKIGKTKRLPAERAKELSNATGVAGNYEVAYQKHFENVDMAEAAVHLSLHPQSAKLVV